MEGHEQDSRYLTLWLCVIVSAVIIFGGWIFVMKYNFNKINAEMSSGTSTFEGAVKEVDEIFDGVSSMLEEQGTVLDNLKAKNEESLKAELVPVTE